MLSSVITFSLNCVNAYLVSSFETQRIIQQLLVSPATSVTDKFCYIKLSVESNAMDNDTNVNAELAGNRNKLPLKTYFSEIEKDDGNFLVALCGLCKPAKKPIRGQYKAPSNFSKHTLLHSLAIM